MNCVRLVITGIDYVPDRLKESDGTVMLDTDEQFNTKLSKQIEELNEVNKILTDVVYTSSVPDTPKNNFFLGRFRLPTIVDNDYKPMRVLYITGSRTNVFRLTVTSFQSERYEINLIPDEEHWLVKLQQLKLNEIKLTTNKFLFNKTNIQAQNALPGYEGEEFGLRFPVGYYGNYIDRKNKIGVPDLKPHFLALWVWQKAFCQIGWQFKSPWLESNIGKRNLRYLMSDDFGKEGNLTTLRNFLVTNSTDIHWTNADRWKSIPWDTIILDPSGGYNPADGHYTGASIMDISAKFRVKTPPGFIWRFNFDIVARIVIQTKYDDFNEEIILIEQIIPSGYQENRTLFSWEFDLTIKEVQIDLDTSIYVTLHYTRDLDEGLLIEKEGKFFNQTVKLFIQDGDSILPQDLLRRDSALDAFKGEVHAISGKIYTNYETNEVILYPPYKTKLPDLQQIDGYFLEDILIDLNEKQQYKSEKIINPTNAQKRYIQLKWKDVGDKAIEQLKLPDGKYYLDHKVDLGDQFEDDVAISENPYYEATLSKLTLVDQITNAVMPQYLDNEDGKQTQKIAPRYLYWHGIDKHIYRDVLPANAVVILFGERAEDIPTAYQFTDVKFISLGTQFSKVNLGYGEETTPLRTTLSKTSLYYTFWRKWIKESNYNMQINLLTFLSPAQYHQYEFRNIYAVNMFGRTTYCRLTAINDFDPCNYISTPINLIPMRFTVNECLDITKIDDDDLEVRYDPCVGNQPELIITKTGNCYYFSMGGSNASPIESITFEYRYLTDTAWTTATSLCNPTGDFEVRMTVNYSDDCPDVVLRRIIEPCSNDPYINAVYNYTDGCFTVSIDGQMLSPIDSILIEYSLDNGATWLTYTPGDCVVTDVPLVMIRATVNYSDGCPDSVLDAELVIPPNPPECNQTTADVMCTESGSFTRMGVIAGDVALDIIEYRHPPETVWHIWDEETAVQPCPFEYRRVIFFCNDECPTYCGTVHTCDCINCLVGVTLADTDNGDGTHTLTATITDCTTPVISWYLNDVLITGETGTTITVNTSGTYKVHVDCGDMCYDEATIDVIVECNLPEGDPVNISVCND